MRGFPELRDGGWPTQDSAEPGRGRDRGGGGYGGWGRDERNGVDDFDWAHTRGFYGFFQGEIFERYMADPGDIFPSLGLFLPSQVFAGGGGISSGLPLTEFAGPVDRWGWGGWGVGGMEAG